MTAIAECHSSQSKWSGSLAFSELMTDEARFDIKATGRRVEAVWYGYWTENLVGQYAERLRELVERDKRVDRLIVDASSVTGCDVLGRGKLADLQEWAKTKLTRSVYVADSARVRGLCLWIVRIAEDNNALVVANHAEVEDWLSGDEGRLERAMQRLSAHLEKIGKASV